MWRSTHAAGGMHTFGQAEGLLAEDKADIVGFARQALADPDWFEKVRLGYGEQALPTKAGGGVVGFKNCRFFGFVIEQFGHGFLLEFS